ncbi:MAG: tRNA (adenosine(37)-N6)-threonylcarbamoyltransferase complex ATPase subunit type 1 TsaE [Actinobacteria bacterium]|nr:tRNA (adenosine(37)-N6)-threonylcarbamoyltransferase complex ATPase subunit type 1 TsaE [Cyanobacteriota bacterium]MCL5771019.1 tRNA (adenosine(37)-N6)-threonylcarbamoyltransferase complex ATPase subunit type 1 TsaE [Actinomycetota bacterium]
MKLEILSLSPENTKKIGNELSRLLSQGDIVFLLGELGGGKTTFISGVAEGLKIKNSISSPSFTLINVYDFIKDNIENRLVHCDLYRIDGFKDIPDIGIEDYIYDKKSIVFIEWGIFLKEKISKNYFEIKFEYFFENSDSENETQDLNQKRKITFIANNSYWKQKLEVFKKQINNDII